MKSSTGWLYIHHSDSGQAYIFRYKKRQYFVNTDLNKVVEFRNNYLKEHNLPNNNPCRFIVKTKSGNGYSFYWEGIHLTSLKSLDDVVKRRNEWLCDKFKLTDNYAGGV
jgi:hypothetical protein